MTTQEVSIASHFTLILVIILYTISIILLTKLCLVTSHTRDTRDIYIAEIDRLHNEINDLRSENRQLHDQLYQQRRRPFISNVVPGGIEKVYVSKRVATYSYYDEPGTSQPGSF